MAQVRTVVIEPLSPQSASKYGKALTFSDVSATSVGDWWKCWEGCAELSAGKQWVGFVKAAAGIPLIAEMEREPGTEMIIPVSGTIVQTVALGDPEGRRAAHADASTARAFVVRPGEALVLAPGVWHAAAFGLDGEASYFYVAERRKADQSEGRLGWVTIADSKLLQPVLPGKSATPESR